VRDLLNAAWFDEEFVDLEFKPITFGGIESAETWGSPTVSLGGGAGDQNLTLTGIGSGESWGSTTVAPQAVNVTQTGIASAEAWGSATVQRGAVNITQTGIASAEAWGSTTVQPGAVNVTQTGIASAESWGATSVTRGPVNVSPPSIASGEAWGSTTVQAGAVSISPTAIGSAEAWGNTTVTAGAVNVTLSAIPSAEAWGTAVVSAGNNVTLTGIASAEAWGSLKVKRSEVFPLRGTFYYSWFDETWTVGGEPVKYDPTLGNYDLDGAPANAIMDQHIAWMDQAKMDVAILSWWEIDDGNLGLTGFDHNEGTRIPRFIDRLEAAGSPFKFCMYYESEGFGDETAAAIQTKLDYIRTNYVSRRDYLYVDGKPVIFVYNSGDTAAANSLQRWSDATNGFTDWFVVMKVFTGYASATPAPNSWHQYGPASRIAIHGTHSYVISPGYWQANDLSDPPGTGAFPYLVRSPADFAAAVRTMQASSNNWKLVTTFNEWGEGTGIEPTDQFSDIYIRILETDGQGWVGPPSIASAEAWGSLTVTPGAVNVSPSSITSAEAWGSTVVTTGASSIVTSGIASGEAWGSATVQSGPVSISLTGIARPGVARPCRSAARTSR
jgi:hypothetical protein